MSLNITIFSKKENPETKLVKPFGKLFWDNSREKFDEVYDEYDRMLWAPAEWCKQVHVSHWLHNKKQSCQNSTIITNNNSRVVPLLTKNFRCKILRLSHMYYSVVFFWENINRYCEDTSFKGYQFQQKNLTATLNMPVFTKHIKHFLPLFIIPSIHFLIQVVNQSNLILQM